MTPADLIQNDTLSAAILAHAVHSFNARDKQGMPLLLSLAVLPLVLHARTTEQVNRRRGDAALYRIADETPRISADLETRAQAMTDQTFDALNLAVACGSVVLAPNAGYLLSGEGLFPIESAPVEVRAKLRAANRLGEWFAAIGVPQTFALLNLRM